MDDDFCPICGAYWSCEHAPQLIDERQFREKIASLFGVPPHLLERSAADEGPDRIWGLPVRQMEDVT